MIRRVQPLLAFAAAHLDEDLSLTSLAAQAGLSAFHLHRVFYAVAGETPKQYTLRLRLGRAAAMLLAGDDSVLNVALTCGFQSHEAFSRAFRRRFRLTPRAYRTRGIAAGAGAGRAAEHAALVDRAGPCIGLFRISGNGRSRRSDMSYSIEKKEVSPQPVLVMRRRVKPSEIATTLAEALQQVFLYAQQTGAAMAGQPFTRYLEWGPGLITIEAGMPVVAAPRDTSGESGVIVEELPGGPVAATTHAGPYDKLPEAHAAIQVWIEAQGLVPAGAPWESYVTDPADYPDPKDWKTDVYWPFAR
jgi:AraC family transcriptional regulator